jgi:Na+/proline symporter
VTGSAIPQLRLPDFLVLGGYFLLIAAIGLPFARRIRRTSTFFIADRGVPWWLSGLSLYMSSFSAATLVYYSALAATLGLRAVFLFWMSVPAALLSTLVTARRWRRTRVETPVEFIEERLGPVMRQACAWQGLALRGVEGVIRLYLLGACVAVGTSLSSRQAIFLAGATVLLYCCAGGLWAARAGLDWNACACIKGARSAHRPRSQRAGVQRAMGPRPLSA